MFDECFSSFCIFTFFAHFQWGPIFMSEMFKTLNGLPATNLGSYISYKVVGMTDPIHHTGTSNDSDKCNSIKRF